MISSGFSGQVSGEVPVLSPYSCQRVIVSGGWIWTSIVTGTWEGRHQAPAAVYYRYHVYAYSPDRDHIQLHEGFGGCEQTGVWSTGTATSLNVAAAYQWSIPPRALDVDVASRWRGGEDSSVFVQLEYLVSGANTDGLVAPQDNDGLIHVSVLMSQGV